MEKIRILGIDPSLRNTGLGIVEYNSGLSVLDQEAFNAKHCQVLVNPQKYTGTEAILNMIEMMQSAQECECYQEVDAIIVESPPVMFNKAWSGGTISSIAHVAGAAVAIFGVGKSHLFRPNEWNKSRKKDVTHTNTIAFLGNTDNWGYEKVIKEKYMEHALDAVSMALWWIKCNYLED